MPTIKPNNWFFLAALLFPVVSGFISNGAAAQDKTEPAKPKVTSVNVKEKGSNARLGQELVVKVENLEAWFKPIGDKKKVLLYLDGHPIPALEPSVYVALGEIHFELHRNDANKQAWNRVLAGDVKRYTKIPNLEVSVGTETGGPIPTEADSIKFDIIPLDFVFLAPALLVLVALGLFVWLAVASNIIRDGGPNPAVGYKPYSLGRFQMAFWFFVVLPTFVLLWAITRDWNNLTPEVLTLMGISATTGLSAVLLDTGKRNSNQTALATQTARKATLESKIAMLDTQIAQPPPANELARLQDELRAAKAELTAVQLQITTLNAALAPMLSKNFFADLVTGDDGISLHRFQMLVWTVMLGMVFLVSVINHLAMPSFNATLLALMGISGATYIGFKAPESNRNT